MLERAKPNPCGPGAARWTVLSARATSLVLAGAVACARTPVPCQAPDECPRNYECLANQCRVEGSDPVAPGTERRVLLATWTSNTSADPEGAAKHVAIDVGFDAPEGVAKQGSLQSAYLVLPVDSSLYLAQTALDAQVARVQSPEPGAPGDTTGPTLDGRVSLGLPLRVNVTPLVDEWLQSREKFAAFRVWVFDESGKALSASKPNPAQARLELYLTARGAE